MTSEQIFMLIAIAVYLAAMLLIGIWCSKKNKTTGDFYLGGRKLGPFVTAMSAEASDMSSWLLMGLPGLAYLTGVADAGWTAIGLAAGTYVNWLIVAKRLRRYSKIANDSITIPDFFQNRYRDNSRLLLCISALVILIFFVPYTASGFAACGKLFSSLFGIDYFWAMVLSAVVIVGYTITGGFLAASTTDFIQSIVMTVALFVVIGFGVSVAGGFEAVFENAKSLPGYLSMTATYSPASDAAQPYPFLSIISTFAWGLGYFGMPHILLRFMAIDDEKKLPLSRRIASVWVVITLAVGVLIGVIGVSMSTVGAIPVLDSTTSETIVIQIADLLSKNGILTALLAGVILAGILASTMSTADSQLLAASSSMSENLLKGVFRLKLSEKKTMLTARLTLVVIAIIAVFIAQDPNSSVFGIVSFAWAGFGAAFGPVMLFSLFWKRTTRWGAFAGMISGGAMVFVWKFLLNPLGGVFAIYELLPAFLVACVLIVVISLCTKAPDKEIVAEFEAAAQKR